MGADAQAIFTALENGKATIYILAMVLAEILYLSERGRIKTNLSAVQSQLKKHPHCQIVPMDLSIVHAAASLTDIPELHDRLIVATASRLGIPLLTNDRLIAAAKSPDTLW